MKEKWKCQGSRFASVLIKMTYPFSFNFTNSYICIILGRKEHKKEYELLGYHRSGFKFRFCYRSHCVTLKVYHTPSISASIFWAMTWWYQVKWLQSLCSSKAPCSMLSTKHLHIYADEMWMNWSFPQVSGKSTFKHNYHPS